MTTRIRYLGIAGYEVVGPSARVLFDPFLRGNPVAPCAVEDLETPDVILVSHAAFDHFGDAAEIAVRTGAPVVCGADSRALLLDRDVPEEQIRPTIWGVRVRVGGVTVIPVECHHWSSATLSDGRVIGGVPLGFVVEFEPGVSIYHYGDSALFGDMRLIRELHQPTVGLLGCAQPSGLDIPGSFAGDVLTGEMSPLEAAMAAEFLGVSVAVASHYTEPDDPDVLAFLRHVPEQDPGGRRTALAPTAGQTIVLEHDNVHVETS
jgi:L-ascorbate metabolism protein UlaG (beta-lactamase superfamily)